MEFQQAIEKLAEVQRLSHAFSHASSIIYYDGVTTAPRLSSPGRVETMGVLSEYSYDITTSPQTIEALTLLRGCPEKLTEHQRREVELLLREHDYISKIPKDEYVAYSMLCNEAEDVWHKAKEQNDFEMFRPYLEKIVASLRKFSEYYKPGQDSYDVQLDEYERGMNKATLDRFFSLLRGRLVPLIKKIAVAKQPDYPFMHAVYPVYKQRILSDRLMEMMSINRDYCAIGETEHPFTIEFNNKDVRITTHYFEDNFLSSMFSVIHEGGHALYELGVADEHAGTVVTGGASMSLHESQSRLFENNIGRSKGFCHALLPVLKEIFPQQFEGVTEEQLYRAANTAQPSLIRTEADELTYSLHIMVRYELEKKLFDGSLAVADLPAAWNAMMKEYLGIDVPDNKQGVLQDSHWSGGMLGYFPSYALGSAYAAQMLDAIGEKLDIDAICRSGDLSPLAKELDERLHRFGSMYDPDVLIEKACGAKFDPEHYINYLINKYSELYGIEA